jgi:AcrR family transcriptional regulator
MRAESPSVTGRSLAPSEPPRVGSRRGDICITAALTFIERGYDATSVNDIAAALGITKAGLYHYISGKESLLNDIIALSMDALVRRVIEPTRHIADPEARFRAIVLTHARVATLYQGALTLLVDEVHALPPPQRRLVNQRKREYVRYVRETIVDLQAAGRAATVDATVAAYSVIGIISWLPHWFRDNGRLTGDAAAEEVLKYVVGGLGLDGKPNDGPASTASDAAAEPHKRPGRRRRLEARAFPKLNPRRFKICMTAARTFVQRGFEATSVNDIAAALGVTKAGLYHYISSKEALFFEIVSLGMDWLDEDVVKQVRDIPETDVRLRETIRRHAALTACNEPWITVLLDDLRALPAAERDAIERRKRVYFETVRGMIRDLQQSGQVRDIDPAIATQSTLAMLVWIPRWMNPSGRLNPEVVSAEVTRIALAALMKHPPPTRLTVNP